MTSQGASGEKILHRPNVRRLMNQLAYKSNEDNYLHHFMLKMTNKICPSNIHKSQK